LRILSLQVLEAMWDDSCSLVLTPQAFSNINPKADIFNNINQQFWEYVLPGCDALGYIACTGTNFCLRARSLAQVRTLHSAVILFLHFICSSVLLALNRAASHHGSLS
jgi:hypothetical protein